MDLGAREEWQVTDLLSSVNLFLNIDAVFVGSYLKNKTSKIIMCEQTSVLPGHSVLFVRIGEADLSRVVLQILLLWLILSQLDEARVTCGEGASSEKTPQPEWPVASLRYVS